MCKNPAIWCTSDRKTVRNAVHNAFLYTLTVGTAFPCIPTAFQQWKWRPHAFPAKMTPGQQYMKGNTKNLVVFAAFSNHTDMHAVARFVSNSI